MSPPTLHPQDSALKASLQTPSEFWHTHAQSLEWETPYSQPLVVKTAKGEEGSSWEWFPDGKISTTYNLITRHVLSGNGDVAAVLWDSPVTGKKRRISYTELQLEVELFAAVLRERGVGRGDRVLIYMPMIPEALIGMLATVHLGAVHSVVFGGFAPRECAKRIESAEPKVVLTTSCGLEGGAGKRRVIPYLPLVREAIQRSRYKPQNTLLYERDEFFQRVDKSLQELNWNKLVRSMRGRLGLRPVIKDLPTAAASTPNTPERNPEIGEAFPSGDAQYIIYTSGTTGMPKGVVRSIGGHLVGLSHTVKHLFGIKGPGDVIFTASDIGWVVGHSYIVYAPLLVGATTVLFEGKPVGTPDAGTFWRIIEEYKVNVFSTAPTALRAIRREDPSHDLFISRDLTSLRGIFLAGERSEPTIVEDFQRLLTKQCAPGAKVVDNWWSSESGSPITGIGLGFEGGLENALEIKPGSAGKAMAGWDLRVVDDEGNELQPGTMGNIVLSPPLAPTGFRTLWQDHPRFLKSYFSRFKNRWLDTGDAGLIDKDGYITILSRTDDILNVASHRLSTGAIEQALLSHPSLSEAYIVPSPDVLKGQVPFAFVVLSPTHPPINPTQLFKELDELVRTQVGPIASLGGVIEGRGMVPKTRSGKTLRRVLRTLVENAAVGEFEREVEVPATIEDGRVVEVARKRVEEYFRRKVGAKL